jgi:RNA polymerase sigma factor (sigma-70 family)
MTLAQGELEAHRGLLWGIAYRMTGVAADADDVVQETFIRAMAKPPARDRPIRPWLVKVAMNAARDSLRRRRRQVYVGPWLPSPVLEERLELAGTPAGGSSPREGADDAPSPEQRYSLRESATFAFLLALEQLTPQRRAVLILRDVFDYSTEETAAALDMSTDAVKQTLLRARRTLASRLEVGAPRAERKARDRSALEALFAALVRGDATAASALLARDVEAHADGGGEFAAAKIVLRGAEQVARVYANLTRLVTPARAAFVEVNGTIAAIFEIGETPFAQSAPRTLITLDTDTNGMISRIYSVMATRKMTAVPAVQELDAATA